MPYDPFRNPYLEALDFGSPRREAAFPALPDEEADSLLGSIAGGALSGLGYIGETLDKPGRAIRGLLAGRPSELANLIPFSDYLGFTDPRTQTTGRQLGEQWGWIDPNTPGLDWGDVGGFGIEVLTDPLSLLGTGLSRAGIAASKVGVLPGKVVQGGKLLRGTREASFGMPFAEALELATRKGKTILPETLEKAATKSGFTGAEELLRSAEPLREGFASIGLPGLNLLGIGPRLPIGTGKIGQGLTRSIDIAADVLGKTAPIRAAKGLFHGPSGGKFDRYGQEVAEIAAESAPEMKQAVAREAIEAREAYNEIAKAFNDSFGQALAPTAPAAASGFPYQVGDVVRAADRMNYGYVEALGPKGAEVFFKSPEGATATVDLSHDILTMAHKAGTKEAAEFVDAKVRDVFDQILTHTQERDIGEAIQQFGRGLNIQPEMSQRIESLATRLKEAEDLSYANYRSLGGKGEDLASDITAHAPRFGKPHDPTNKIEKALANLAQGREYGVRAAGSLAREEVTRSIPEHIVNQLALDAAARGEDAAAYLAAKPELQSYLGSGLSDKAIKEAVDAGLSPQMYHAEKLAEYLKDKPIAKIYPNPRLVDHSEYLKDLALKSKNLEAIHEAFYRNQVPAAIDKATGLPSTMNIVEAFKKAGLDHSAARDAFAKRYGIDDLKNINVPVELVDAARASREIPKNKAWMDAIGQKIDSFTNWFKEAVYLPWPAAWTRNLTSGQIANMTSGNVPFRKIPAYAKEVLDEGAVILGKKVRDPKWEKELEIAGIRTARSQDVALEMTGKPWKVGETWRQAGEKAAKPSIIPGLDYLPGSQKARQIYQTVLGTGSKMHGAVEDMNRVPLYIFLRKQGDDMATAARKTFGVQFDYAKESFTPFERDVMRRLVPFYSFQRRALPFVFKTLLERPGGAMVQTIRASNELRQQGGYVPDYIGRGLAIPLGESAPGTERFISQFDTVPESVADLLRPGSGITETATKTLQGFLGQTNPLVKLPLEMVAGKQFFSGRDLADLDSRIGRLAQQATGRNEPPEVPLLADQLLMSSPLSRLVSTAGTLVDTRKGAGAKALNLLTGVRLTDVDTQKAREIETRKLLEAELKQPGSPVKEFSSLYVPKAQAGQLSPDQVQKMRLLRNLEARAKEAALRKRAEAGDKEAQRELLKMAMKGR